LAQVFDQTHPFERSISGRVTFLLLNEVKHQSWQLPALFVWL
jgi:hypothetical protein